MKTLKYHSLLQSILVKAEFAQFNGMTIYHFHGQQACYGGVNVGRTLKRGLWRLKYAIKIVRRILELPFSAKTLPVHHQVIRLSIDSVDLVQLRKLVIGSYRLVVDLMRVKAIADSTRMSVCVWVSPAAAEIVASSIKRSLPSACFDQADRRIAAQGRQT